MTESLIRENETHLCGPRGARKRHSKLARGPICCYFINRPASAEEGGGKLWPIFSWKIKISPLWFLRKASGKKRRSGSPCAERWRSGSGIWQELHQPATVHEESFTWLWIPVITSGAWQWTREDTWVCSAPVSWSQSWDLLRWSIVSLDIQMCS